MNGEEMKIRKKTIVVYLEKLSLCFFFSNILRQAEETVVIALNNTQFRAMFNRLALLMATALHTSLVTITLPVRLTTSGERHIQNLTDEDIFRALLCTAKVAFSVPFSGYVSTNGTGLSCIICREYIQSGVILWLQVVHVQLRKEGKNKRK
jgi:hypothetical protein